MKLVQQPAGSNQCGQACVAMLLDISLPLAIEKIGKRGLTRTKDLTKVLQEEGCVCLDRLRRGEPACRGVYLCKVRWARSGKSHWVVWHRIGIRHHFYDPSLTHPTIYPVAGWVSSYVEIERTAA